MLGSANKLKIARQIALTGAVDGNANFDGSESVSITTSLKGKLLTNENLNNCKTGGLYYSPGNNSCLNKPSGVNNFGLQVIRMGDQVVSQILYCNGEQYNRSYIFDNGSFYWTSWTKVIIKGDFAVITGSTTTTSDSLTATTKVNYPNGYSVNNCVVISIMGGRTVGGIDYPWTTSLGKDSSSYLLGCAELGVSLDSDGITVRRSKISNSEPVSTKKFKLVLMKVS